jgi:hypothetical protein
LDGAGRGGSGDIALHAAAETETVMANTFDRENLIACLSRDPAAGLFSYTVP